MKYGVLHIKFEYTADDSKYEYHSFEISVSTLHILHLKHSIFLSHDTIYIFFNYFEA